MNTYELAGKQYPILGGVFSLSADGIVPLIDLPMMTDEQWQELARLHPAPQEDAYDRL